MVKVLLHGWILDCNRNCLSISGEKDRNCGLDFVASWHAPFQSPLIRLSAILEVQVTSIVDSRNQGVEHHKGAKLLVKVVAMESRSVWYVTLWHH